MGAQVYHIGMDVCICRVEPENSHDVYLIKYSPQTVDFVWPTVEPWLAKTLSEAPPWWRIEDLHQRCKKGDLMLWVACVDGKPLGVILSGLDKYHAATVCGVPWIGGNKMMLWIGAAQKIIEQWAKEAGATFLCGGGREGWARVAGMKQCGITLIKEL